jgi:hypothetical protein
MLTKLSKRPKTFNKDDAEATFLTQLRTMLRREPGDAELACRRVWPASGNAAHPLNKRGGDSSVQIDVSCRLLPFKHAIQGAATGA